jgi:hypothetical protein
MISPLSHQAFEHSLALDNIVAEAVPLRLIIFPALEKTSSHSAAIAGMLLVRGADQQGAGLKKATEPQLHPKEDYDAVMR